MLSIVKSLSLQGLNGVLINVEVDVSAGMPVWDIIGLPDASLKESKERVKTAIRNCDITIPSRRYIINLSLSGVESDPALVVAPIKVNLGKSNLIDLALGPFPIIISKLKSSNAGYKISSTFLFNL